MSLNLIEEAIEKIATESTGEYLRDYLFAKDSKERKAAHKRFGQKSEHSVGTRAAVGGGLGGLSGALVGGAAGGGPGAVIGGLAGLGIGAGTSAASAAIRNKFIREARANS